MASQERRRQKKREKQKKKREAVKVAQRRRPPPPTGKQLIAEASEAEFGPCWVSSAIWDVSELALVTVVVTRKLPGDVLLPQIVLVDRTCLGIKDAAVMPVSSKEELWARLGDFSEQDPLEPCEPLFAQSVVFNALDYSERLGFSPHRDFEPKLFGPRPESLMDTPLADAPKPMYAPGPDDDFLRIVNRLQASVGEHGYDILMEEFEAGVPAVSEGDEAG